MKIEEDVKLDFADVLIKPKRSEAASRAAVEVQKLYVFKHSRMSLTCSPIIAANMDTTGTFKMADTLNPHGCMVALHKFYKNEELAGFYFNKNFYTIGIQQVDFDKLKDFVSTKYNGNPFTPPMICIDVANGYTQSFVDFVRKVRDLCPHSTIMAGNVATAEMTQELIINGKADIIKIGIGPGSACTTRLQTGVGYCQLSAVAECADVAHGLGAHICADGGIREPGDVCKALGAGADFVMIGGMLAGTDECEGHWKYKGARIWKYIKPKEWEDDCWSEGCLVTYHAHLDMHEIATQDKEKDGKVYDRGVKHSLLYHGMSSREAMEQHHGGMADYKTAEGIEFEVPYKGKAEEVIKDILGGIRSACAYVGAKGIKDFAKCCTFVRVNRIK